ncbi:MAG TPA: alpha/beta hydrolase-fold protein [Gammaproteobacteria bacterium]|nr:alpha/beta hydrolase-fold protein [Gammaproteobacteria bacterium]
MNGALRKLEQAAPPTAQDIDEFIASNSFPLVERQGVTFVYRGEAEEVALRIFIQGLPARQPLERMDDSDLWTLFLDLPRNSRIEYKFEVRQQGENQWIVDPLNPHVATDPYGANSVLRSFGYERPAWTLPDAAARPGSLVGVEVPSKLFDAPRRTTVYLPARFRRLRRYPLLIVHDGEDFLRYADIKVVLDNLIHRLEIPPMIVALTQAGDRLVEYAANDRHADWLATELLPELEKEFPLLGEPASRALMGASFGGVASLHAAWRHPGLFDRLMLASGSFAFSDIGAHKRGPVFDPVAAFVNEFRNSPGRPAERLFICCGIYESLIYENRSLVPLLQEHGMQVRYEEVRDAHNWENWRDRLQAGLTWLFPGPLWMVYE